MTCNTEGTAVSEVATVVRNLDGIAMSSEMGNAGAMRMSRADGALLAPWMLCRTTCYNLEACVVLNGLRPTRRPQWHNGSLTALGGMCLAMWRSKHPTHYDHTTRAHRHTVPGHLPPPVRLGLGGQRRQGILLLPSGARGGSCANLCGRSTSYPTSLLPAAAGVRSTAPPACKEGPGSGSEWKNGAKCLVINFSSWIHWLTKAVGTSFKELILPPYHRATSVLQRSICTTRPGSSIRDMSTDTSVSVVLGLRWGVTLTPG
eukprot:scaffold2709_cov122-Isochrysis_galbana.AAC.3